MIYHYSGKIYKKIIYNNINNNFINELNKLSNDLNKLFFNANDLIKKMLNKKKIKTRQSKISFNDILCYIFNYSFINNTKQSVVSDYNFDNNICVNRTSFYKKELKIPLNYYKILFTKIKFLLNKYLNKNDCVYSVIAVDGTYSNTNILNDKSLETTLNMGYYDATNHIPIDLELKDGNYKNKEIKSFVEHLEKNNFNKENVILVFDRAYFSYDLINKLNELKLNFVIRSKNNSKYLKDSIKNKDNLNKIDSNNRFINHKSKRIIIKKDENNKDVKLEENIECNLVTNLKYNDFNDDKIKDLYMQRWSVEVFFKLLKSNFKFSNLREHNSTTVKQYNKKYLIILINLHIIRLIEFVYDKYHKITKNNKNNKNINNYNCKYNNTLMIYGLKKIINSIIKSKIDKNILLNYCSNYIKKNYSIKDISNPRVSKTPFSKWYVKSYSDYYKYVTIIKALRNNNFDELNKNLKLLANNLKIIE